MVRYQAVWSPALATARLALYGGKVPPAYQAAVETVIDEYTTQYPPEVAAFVAWLFGKGGRVPTAQVEEVGKMMGVEVRTLWRWASDATWAVAWVAAGIEGSQGKRLRRRKWLRPDGRRAATAPATRDANK